MHATMDSQVNRINRGLEIYVIKFTKILKNIVEFLIKLRGRAKFMYIFVEDDC